MTGGIEQSWLDGGMRLNSHSAGGSMGDGWREGWLAGGEW